MKDVSVEDDAEHLARPLPGALTKYCLMFQKTQSKERPLYQELSPLPLRALCSPSCG